MRRVLLFLILAVSRLVAQPTITNVYVAAQSATTATIVWTTNSPATSQVVYGLNTGGYFPFSTPVNSTLSTSHSMTMIVLLPGQTYNIAAVSSNGGGRDQSSEVNFTMCGGGSKPMIPATGTATNYYEYGSFTMTWNPPAGSSGTPRVCGEDFPTTVTGVLSGGASLSASVGDALKAVPGPGTWTTVVNDAGSLSPLTVVSPLSAQNQDISTQLQQQALTSGLTGVLANTGNSTCFPSFVCSGSGGGNIQPTPQFIIFQQPTSGTQATAGPTNISTDVSGNNLNIPGITTSTNITVSSLGPGFCVQASTGGALTSTGQPCGTGSGTLSGQTTNFLPRATSATASTISSQFGETGSGSGAIGSYSGMVLSAVQLARGIDNGNFNIGGGLASLGGGQGAATLQSFYLNPTSSPQNALMIKPTFLGAGCYGGGFDSCRNSNGMFHMSIDNAVPGIFQDFAISEQRDSVGDARGYSDDSIQNLGFKQSSDEGNERMAIFGGEGAGYLHATISSVAAGDELILSGVSGCPQGRSSFSNCNATSGGEVVDTTTAGYAAQITGRITLNYGTGNNLTAWTMSSAVPISSAWGYANPSSGVPVWAQTSALLNAPVPETFTVNLSLNGVNSPASFTTGNACYATWGVDGGQLSAQVYLTQLTAGATSGSTQSITINALGVGVNVIVMQGGVCGYAVSFDKYLSYTGYREEIPALGSTAGELIYVGVSVGDFATLPEVDSTPVTADNTANSAVTLYPYASVVAQVGTTVGGTPAPDGNPSIGPHLAGTFIAGHTIEGPHYFSQRTVAITTNINCDMPDSCIGAIFSAQGPGYAGINLNGLLVQNNNPYSYYGAGGGDVNVLPPENGVAVLGPYATSFFSQYLPLGGLLAASFYVPGTTGGRIIATPGGNLDVSTSSGTDTWTLGNANFSIPQGGIAVNGFVSASGVDINNGDDGITIQTTGFGQPGSIFAGTAPGPFGGCNWVDLDGTENPATTVGMYSCGNSEGETNVTLSLTAPQDLSFQVAGTPYVDISNGLLAISETRTMFGPGGWAYSSSPSVGSTGDAIYNNGVTDSSGSLFYYGDNTNFGIDTAPIAYKACTGQTFRFVHNLDESGGVVLGCFDSFGDFSVAGNTEIAGNLVIDGTCTIGGVPCGGGGSIPGTVGQMLYSSGSGTALADLCTTDGSGHFSCPSLASTGGSGSDPSEIVLGVNGNAPVVNASSFTIAAPATITTALTWVAPQAPCSGFVFVTDVSGVGSLICNPHFDDGGTTVGKLTANLPIVAPSFQFGTPVNAAFSNPSAGVISADTTTTGDALGEILAGSLGITEGSTPSGASGFGLLYANSSTHRISMNNNNSGGVEVVGISGAGTPGNCLELAANGIDITPTSAGCFPATLKEDRYWSISPGTFAIGTFLGPTYFYDLPIGTFTPFTTPLIARISGTVSCTSAPALGLYDLGTSSSTAIGSATLVTSLNTGTSDGVYQTNVSSLTFNGQHYYAVAITSGTCVTPPTIDFTTQW